MQRCNWGGAKVSCKRIIFVAALVSGPCVAGLQVSVQVKPREASLTILVEKNAFSRVFCRELVEKRSDVPRCIMEKPALRAESR
jgi:hypothetical protein